MIKYLLHLDCMATFSSIPVTSLFNILSGSTKINKEDNAFLLPSFNKKMILKTAFRALTRKKVKNHLFLQTNLQAAGALCFKII